MACIDCLDDSKTIIPTPICGDDCSEDLNCVDILNSGCIISNPTLTCLGLNSGVTLSVVLQAIDAKLCQSLSNLNACKVKVNAEDDCCDFLGNKIDVAGGLIKKIETDESNEDCRLLTIKHPEWSYNDISLSDYRFTPGGTSPYTTLPRPQVGAYLGGQNENTFVHEVKLRGVMVLGANSLELGQSQSPLGFLISPSIFLPLVIGNINNINKRPVTTKYFSGSTIVGTEIFNYNIIIGTDGSITFSAVSNVAVGNRTPLLISLDGINYSI